MKNDSLGLSRIFFQSPCRFRASGARLMALSLCLFSFALSGIPRPGVSAAYSRLPVDPRSAQSPLAAGDLDPSFGSAGKVTTDFPGGDDDGHDVLIQPDGKIVVVGAHDGQFALARYNTNGTLDSGFGGGGIVTTDFSADTDSAEAVALQGDGKLVVAGSAFSSATNFDFAVARYNTDGSLDSGFGASGKTTTDFSNGSDQAFGVAIQADGAIVVAGASSSNIAVARYNTGGMLDTTFGPGANGKVTFDFFSSFDSARAVAIQSDQKIVVAGVTFNGFNNDFAVVRFNTNGTPDSGFGTSGRRNIIFPGLSESADTLVIQSDQKIVVAGTTGTDFALVRLNTNGFEDSGFGSSGKVTTDISSSTDQLGGLAIQADGSIVAAGRTKTNADNNFALARYSPGGILDNSFDGDGKLTTDFSGANDYANGVALQADGQIVAAGSAFNDATSNDFALARYGTTGVLDTNFDTDGKLATDLPSGFDQGNAVAIQPDGKVLVAGQHNGDFALARYNTDGSLDSAFGTAGRVVTIFPKGHSTNGAFALVLQPDNKIIAAGRSFGGISNYDFTLVRYNTDGSLDTAFDGDGKVITDLSGSDDTVYALALQADGKIVAGGNSTFPANYSLARYNTNGSLDTTFDGEGLVSTNISADDVVYSLAIQPDGKIVAAGSSGTNTALNSSLARYNTNGSLDTGFGPSNNGKVLIDFAGGNDSANAVALQPDGKVLTAGYAFTSGSQNFVVLRLNANGTIDTGFGTSGATATDFAGSTDAANAMLLGSDGKITLAGYAFTGMSFDFALARYTSNGMLDSSFGAGGKTTTNFAGSTDVAIAIGRQADGKVVAAGYTYTTGASYDFALARYDGGAALKTSFDFDGDRKAEVSVFRPANGVWYTLNSSNGAFVGTGWGTNGDVIVPADYDGDGRADIAVFRPSNGVWYILNSSNGSFNFIGWGMTGDLAVPADYDADGKADLAVFRPTDNNWFIRNSSDGSSRLVNWGNSGDKPAPADYDGDGKADIAVFRPSNGTWYITNSSDQSFRGVGWGTSGDVVTPGNFDGDGKADIAVFRPSNGVWYILNSSNGSFNFIGWGTSGDTAAPADYDADGKTDVAVWRQSTGAWYILNSSNGSTGFTVWGMSGDVPVPSAFTR